MLEWWTYRPSDFLMFLPRTYYRLFELYNADVWPLQIVMIATGLAALFLVWRGAHGRIVAIGLAAAWMFAAWAYHFERYATISTGAPHFAAGFAMQAARNSRAASGAEHQFSHLWDMQHHTHEGKAPSHGFKVGIGTLAVTALYEFVLKPAW